jgi:hypothetical protein
MSAARQDAAGEEQTLQITWANLMRAAQQIEDLQRNRAGVTPVHAIEIAGLIRARAEP